MSSGTRDDWRPLRPPGSPDAARVLEEWLAGGRSTPVIADDLDFRGADLSGGPFGGSSFRRANLADAVARGVELWRSSCEGARFIRAVLTDADFVKAHLHHASFVRAVLIGADLTRAEGLDVRFVQADLRRADLTDATLVACDFTGADLSGARVDKTSLRDSHLVDATVAGLTGTVFGPVVVAAGRALDGADLERWFAAHGAGVSVLSPAYT
ncbi:MAG: pentapeptide repeat-containing protein [Saccharothrix sp.]|nr:pentapeptide repeat-containing protein [Saccharothrix sp.]